MMKFIEKLLPAASLLLIIFFLATQLPFQARAATDQIYIAESGNGNGSSCASPHTAAWFNAANNWGIGAGQITAGDTVHLCGTLITPLVFRGSGVPGAPITLLFDNGAKLSRPDGWGDNGAINTGGQSWIVIDGGANGIIESTSNGTGRPYQQQSVGVFFNGKSDNVIAQNLTIRNLYVHVEGSADPNGFGAGFGGPFGDNVTIRNNTISDALLGIAAYFPGNAVRTNYQVYGNKIFHTSMGITIGSGNGGAVLNDSSVHDNDIADGHTWDGCWNNCTVWAHHDGIHQWSKNSSGSATNNLKIYNNYIHGDWGKYTTAYIYTEGNPGTVTNALIYNNVLKNEGPNTPGDGYIYIVRNDGAKIFNNTIIGNGTADGVQLDGNSTNTQVRNNIFWNTHRGVVAFPGSDVTADNNVYYQLSDVPGNQFVAYGSWLTFAAWQAKGLDPHGMVADPKLDANFVPMAGSAAAGAGANLSAFFTTDRAGTARPIGVAAWDSGAYQSGANPNPNPNPNPAPNGTVTVSNAAELTSAIANAGNGTTILLNPGSYGTVNISNHAFSSPLTLRSANTSNPAHLDSLNIRSSQGIVANGLDIGRGLLAGEPEYTQINSIYDSSNITFDNVHLHGSIDGTPANDGWMLFVHNANGLAIKNSTIEQAFRGIIMEQSSNVSVANNRFHDIRSDGADFAAMSNVTVDGNSFTNFYPSAGDHADAIQFWNVGQPRGSDNVTVKNNVVLQGSGVGTQGIFISDGEQHPYTNVTVQNNLLYSNDQYNGIMVSNATGVKVFNNTVVSRTGDEKGFWIRLENDSNVALTGNVSDRLVTNNLSGLAQSGNLFFADDPNAAARIPNLNGGAAAKVGDFVIASYGYQPSGVIPVTPPAPTPCLTSSSAASDACPAPNPQPKPNPQPNPGQNPPATPGTYPVYQGCQVPGSSYARTIYIDPANGSDSGDGSQANPYRTLSATLTAKKIQIGDHVVLLPGNHGDVKANMYVTPGLVGGNAWTWFDFRPGATANLMSIANMAHVLITNPEINNGSKVPMYGFLLELNNDSNVIVADGNIYGTKDSANWSANDWVNAPNGVNARNTNCFSFVRNKVTNTRFGFGVSNDGSLTYPGNSAKAYAYGNEIANFSGDGMRPNASDIIFRNNYIHDEYVNAADGDGNHDDGIQIFALNGAKYYNITIDGNYITETTNPNRRFNASIQGIGYFDGPVDNLRITNNTILISGYHGISAYGASNSLVENNTVANPTNNGFPSWIYLPKDPKGNAGNITGNNIVRNNIADRVMGDNGIFTNNFQNLKPTDTFVIFDRANARYDFNVKPTSPAYGTGAGVINGGFVPGQLPGQNPPGTLPDPTPNPAPKPCPNGTLASADGTCQAPVPGAKPTITVSASPTSITKGALAKISWSATNVPSCTASGGLSGGLPNSGSRTVSPSVTTTYTISCSGPNGAVQSSVTVTVAPVIAPCGTIGNDVCLPKPKPLPIPQPCPTGTLASPDGTCQAPVPGAKPPIATTTPCADVLYTTLGRTSADATVSSAALHDYLMCVYPTLTSVKTATPGTYKTTFTNGSQTYYVTGTVGGTAGNPTYTETVIYPGGINLYVPKTSQADTSSLAASAALFTDSLKQGSRGEQVSALQTLLKLAGYFTYAHATGYFGTSTKEAVAKLQKEYGLDQVGAVGAKTKALLNLLTEPGR